MPELFSHNSCGLCLQEIGDVSVAATFNFCEEHSQPPPSILPSKPVSCSDARGEHNNDLVTLSRCRDSGEIKRDEYQRFARAGRSKFFSPDAHVESFFSKRMMRGRGKTNTKRVYLCEVVAAYQAGDCREQRVRVYQATVPEPSGNVSCTQVQARCSVRVSRGD